MLKHFYSPQCWVGVPDPPLTPSTYPIRLRLLPYLHDEYALTVEYMRCYPTYTTSTH